MSAPRVTARVSGIPRELGFFALAVVLSVGAIAILLTTSRGAFLLYDGDSVLLELMHRAVVDGTPPDWSMSPVLFFFPELPVYLGLRALVPTTQAAVILNAVTILALLYLLLRSIAAQLTTDRRRAPLITLIAFVPVVLCLATEHSSDRESFELVSLLIIPTYYWGAVLAGFASISLALVVVRHATGRTGRVWPAVVALFVLALLTTASDPIYLLWGLAPLLGALLLLSLLRRMPWRATIITALAALLGVGGGMLVRVPLDRFLSPAGLSYLHPGQQLHAALYYPKRVLDLALSGWQGGFEVLLLMALVGVAILAIVLAWRTRERPERLLLALIGVAAPFGAYLAVVVAGPLASRYLQPFYLAPLLSILVLLAIVIEARAERMAAPSGRVPSARRGVGVMSIAAVLVLVASAFSVIPTAADDDTRPDCLQNWIDGRDLTGAGQYWETRDLVAYGDRTVRLVQVVPTLTVFPWLVDLAPYYHARVSYLVSPDTNWLRGATKLIGKPATIVACPEYTIYDYAGTTGQTKLTELVTRSAIDIGRRQGFLQSTAP